MSSFESTLARMKELYKYGHVNEEQERINNSIEHHATGADGREYGIIRENNKYYIKSAPHGKGNILEAYDYINGFMRKKEYQYSSYPDALKNFHLKMKSLNEANDAVIELDNLDRFKRNDILKESADAEEMKNELARVRQIMHNTAVIMKESTCYGKTPITNQPEAAKGNSGDTDTPYTENAETKDLNHEPKTATEPASQSTPFEKKVNASKESKINEDTAPESAFDAGLPNFPSGGTGIADTKQNNEPFTQTVAESCDEDDDVANAASELGDDDDMTISDEPEFDTVPEEDGDDVEPEDLTDEVPEDGEDAEEVEDDSDLDDNDFEGTEDGENDDTTSDLESRIAELEAKIAELQSQIDSTEVTTEPDEVGAASDEPEEGEMGSDNEYEFSEDDINDELNESYHKKVNGIIDSVWRKHLNENELHVFGQHPGYRKKPMTLPATGSDKNEHGRDWNDESVHNEKPFGSEIGKSDPYSELVKRLSNDVKNQLKGMTESKKKVK